MTGSGNSRAASTNSNVTAIDTANTMEKSRLMRGMSFLPQYWEIRTLEPLTSPRSVAVKNAVSAFTCETAACAILP